MESLHRHFGGRERVMVMAKPRSGQIAVVDVPRPAQGGQWIAGMKMRDKSAHAAKVLATPGRFADVDEHLRVKEVQMSEATPGVRWVVCHNRAEATQDAATRQDGLTYLTGELDRIAAARARADQALAAATSDAARKRLEAELAGHSRAECALRDHKTLGRWLRQTSTGRLVIDKKAVAAEAKLDGKYLLSTSDQHLSPADIALGYKNLLKAERGFRDLKTGLLLRPVFHRLEPRTKAYVLICWLALLLIRVAEQRTGETWNTIATHLSRIAAVTLTGPAGTVVQSTELTDKQRAILTACQVAPPPRITSLNPL